MDSTLIKGLWLGLGLAACVGQTSAAAPTPAGAASAMAYVDSLDPEAQATGSGVSFLPDASSNRQTPAPEAHERKSWKDPLAMPAPPSTAHRRAFARKMQGKADAGARAIAESARKSLLERQDKMLAERKQALGQMGIDGDKTGYLYVLVSTSMPQTLLDGYAQAAVWSGAMIEFRGVPPGKKLGWFFKNVIGKLIRKNGASPTVAVDPRSFSAFGVTAVPTLVYSTVPPGEICAQRVDKKIPQDNKKPPIPYKDCAPLGENDYWKMAGAVSISYALKEFSEAGAPGAGRLLEAANANPWFTGSKKPTLMTRDEYAKGTGPGDLRNVLDRIGAPTPFLPPPDASVNTTPFHVFTSP